MATYQSYRNFAMERKAFDLMSQKLASLGADQLASFWDGVDNNQTSSEVKYEMNQHGHAVIRMNGVASKSGPDWFEQFLGMDGFSTEQKALEITHAARNPSVKGLMVKIESPGGAVSGTPLVADALMAARMVKPVVVYTEDLMASAAYWIGSQADYIVAGKAAEVGSIGVYCALYDYSKAFDNAGIEVTVVKSAPKKGAGVMGSAISDEAIADEQRIVNDIHELFVADVARGRGMKAKWARNANANAKPVPDTGQVWIAEEAKDLGLIDQIGSESDAIAALNAMIKVQGEQRLMGNLAQALKSRGIEVAEDATEEQVSAALAAFDEKLAAEALTRANELATQLADKRIADEKARMEAEAKARDEARMREDFVKSLVGKSISIRQQNSALQLAEANFDAFKDFVSNQTAPAPIASADPIKSGGDSNASVGAIDLYSVEGRQLVTDTAKAIQAKNKDMSFDDALSIALVQLGLVKEN